MKKEMIMINFNFDTLENDVMHDAITVMQL